MVDVASHPPTDAPAVFINVDEKLLSKTIKCGIGLTLAGARAGTGLWVARRRRPIAPKTIAAICRNVELQAVLPQSWLPRTPVGHALPAPKHRDPLLAG